MGNQVRLEESTKRAYSNVSEMTETQEIVSSQYGRKSVLSEEDREGTWEKFQFYVDSQCPDCSKRKVLNDARVK